MEFGEKTKLEDLNIDITSWKNIAKYASFTLINQKCLEEYDNPVHDKCIDLAMVYIIQNETQGKLLIHMVQEEDLEKLGITKSDLHKVAVSNAMKNRRFRIVPFSETLEHNLLTPLSRRMPGTALGISAQIPQIIIDVDPETEEENVLVGYNKNRPFGASYMFMPSVLEEVFKRFGNNDFYIIPMSRHQAWFVKGSYVTHEGTRDYRDVNIDLLDMLEEHNDKNNKRWQDILSYQLYYFMGNDGKVIIPIKN